MFSAIYCMLFMDRRRRRCHRTNFARQAYRLVDRLPDQIKHMRDLINISDTDCIAQLRMDRNAFGRLCYLLENIGGLVRTRNVPTTEQVAIFLTVLAQHKKNRVVKFDFKRSVYTISKHFNIVVQVVLRLHYILLVDPKPVDETCTDDTWKWFKGCLGALDGTYIDVRVLLSVKARYRNRKGDVFLNVLGVCDPSMKYTFVLSGWEGSAADSRVLRDVVTRPNGLRVPTSNYYLCDCGYTNGPGFLAPYRGVRYHLDEWSSGRAAPQNHMELFNLRHAKARNIIERSWCLLKYRWAILRSNSWYPIKTQNCIIMACCLLHNFIRTAMPVDPLEDDIPEDIGGGHNTDDGPDFVDQVETSQIWTTWRDTLAISMYNDGAAILDII
ncbi:hypothetical protein DH2020_012374 [Rehmannia glutinosa]|uniref:DDE Tnp4 domain-containing protein n=1 Tax=Rehmannia glutinosa TaxID=99300 RepID=A0ABR0WZT1_REHGL